MPRIKVVLYHVAVKNDPARSLQRVSKDCSQFKQMLAIALPKPNDTTQLSRFTAMENVQ